MSLIAYKFDRIVIIYKWKQNRDVQPCHFLQRSQFIVSNSLLTPCFLIGQQCVVSTLSQVVCSWSVCSLALFCVHQQQSFIIYFVWYIWSTIADIGCPAVPMALPSKTYAEFVNESENNADQHNNNNHEREKNEIIIERNFINKYIGSPKLHEYFIDAKRTWQSYQI